MMEENKKSPKRFSMKKLLLCWTAFLLVLGLLVCGVLYSYLKAYEAARPERLMDDLLAETSAEEWIDIALKGLADGANEYDNTEELADSYRNTFLQGGVSYMKDMLNSGDGVKVYRVRMGNSDICRVTLLEQQASVGFGMHGWELSEITPAGAADNLSGLQVEIIAPSTEPVSLNGKLLTEAYITAEEALPEISAAEARSENAPKLVTYTPDTLYGNVIVTDGKGNEVAPESNDGTKAVYRISAEGRKVTVTAPDSATVYLGGIALTEADLTGTKDSLIAGLDNYTDGSSHVALYEFDPLYGDADFTACGADGSALTAVTEANGNIGFYRPEDLALKEAMEASVQNYLDLYMDYSSCSFNAVKMQQLLSYTLRNTLLYDYIYQSRFAMKFASNTEINYSELEFTNFRSVSDTCFLCTLRYTADFNAQNWYESYSYTESAAYELVFVNKGGTRWYTAVMNAISE